MTLEDYLQKKRIFQQSSPQYRELCVRCIQPTFSCYCADVQEFDPLIHFVILIHPIEMRRRIATGRMSSLCLRNSYLIMGQDYTLNPLVNRLVQDQSHHSVILYPGANSSNLSIMTPEARREFGAHKKLRVFVIDGTWATARKMIGQSQNLLSLPRICFTPSRPSNFRVRKQPSVSCHSTIEAIHQTIEFLGDSQGFSVRERTHDRLLQVFDSMVERQLKFVELNETRESHSARR